VPTSCVLKETKVKKPIKSQHFVYNYVWWLKELQAVNLLSTRAYECPNAYKTLFLKIFIIVHSNESLAFIYFKGIYMMAIQYLDNNSHSVSYV